MKNIVHRAIANARERDRTESINNAFNKLRTLLPTEPAERKLSKVEILRLATSYIRHLSNIHNAKLNGLSEKNVCKKNKHDFCTFCVTALKSTHKSVDIEVKNTVPSTFIQFQNNAPLCSTFCDFSDDSSGIIFVPLSENECSQYWTDNQQEEQSTTTILK